MKERNKNFILTILGILFIAFGTLAIINIFINGVIDSIFWICYFSVFIIGIGILIKNGELILSQLNILTIFLLIWIGDFFYILVTGNQGLGVTNFFKVSGTLSTIISLQHFFVLPLAFFALYLVKYKQKDTWKISIIEMTFIFIFLQIFGSKITNVNCVFRSCSNLLQNIDPVTHIIYWFIIVFSGILLTNYIINKIKIFQKK